MVERRYEFLAQLHQLLQPAGYLEIGVQAGNSLRLASCPSLGIDPYPVVINELTNGAYVHVAPADTFFSEPSLMESMLPKRIDLAFIDGMHLAEFALRDFINVERVSHSKTVIVFDDVLPYNDAIANRVQPPGDWTGDVWKVIGVLAEHRRDLRCMLVDTFPTGSLVVFDVDPSSDVLPTMYQRIEPVLQLNRPVPLDLLNRSTAIGMDDAIKTLGEWL